MSHFSKEKALNPQGKKTTTQKHKKARFNYFSSIGLTRSDTIHSSQRHKTHYPTTTGIHTVRSPMSSGHCNAISFLVPRRYRGTSSAGGKRLLKIIPFQVSRRLLPRVSPFSSATSSSPTSINSFLSLTIQLCMHTARGHNIGSLERFIQQKYFIWPENYY